MSSTWPDEKTASFSADRAIRFFNSWEWLIGMQQDAGNSAWIFAGCKDTF